MKIALVYDWIDTWGGAERVLQVFQEMFPEADWYTSTYNGSTVSWFHGFTVKTSFLDRFPSFIKKNRIRSLLFYPFAFESFDFGSYDLVISITSSFAKGIITQPGTKHVCYILTPTRFLWGNYQGDYYNPMQKFLLHPLINHLKKWDIVASERPDTYVAISKTVEQRVKDVYKKDSTVIYPPFDAHYWENIKDSPPMIAVPSQFYLVVSRLETYKKTALAIEACQKLKRHLIIVGAGTQRRKLARLADPTSVHFLKDVNDSQLAWLYKHAEALIMPQEEDFGYASLEAQYFGCPVIAFNKGGASETVLEGKTGLFFEKQTVQHLAEAIEKYESKAYNLKVSTQKIGKQHIKVFDKETFIKNFQKVIDL